MAAYSCNLDKGGACPSVADWSALALAVMACNSLVIFLMCIVFLFAAALVFTSHPVNKITYMYVLFIQNCPIVSTLHCQFPCKSQCIIYSRLFFPVSAVIWPIK